MLKPAEHHSPWAAGQDIALWSNFIVTAMKKLKNPNYKYPTFLWLSKIQQVKNLFELGFPSVDT